MSTSMSSMPDVMGTFVLPKYLFSCFSLGMIFFVLLSFAISGSKLLVAAVPIDYRTAIVPFTTD